MTEREIVKKAKKDVRYFDMIYNQYFPKINNFVYHRVSFEDDRKEIVSSTFFKAMKKLNQFQFFTFKPTSFSAWLYRIAINEIKLYYRYQTRNSSLNQKIEHNLKAVESSTEFLPPVSYEIIKEKMKTMTDEEQNIIALRFFEKMKLKDIGAIFNKSEGAIKVKLHRTLKKLRNLLEEK